MKKIKLITAALTIVCLASGMTADARSIKTGKGIRKGDQKLGTPVELDVGISFSANSGQTITDKNGTTYVFYGLYCWEQKIYPLEYWGVFPLYFFGDRVGVNVSVKNKSATKNASLRVTTECYCLKTDGGNGAQLLALQSREITVNASETKSIDASFVGEFVEGAESGLDRFLVKIYEASSIQYVVVRDGSNKVKYEDATVGLGEDGAKETDNFLIVLTPASSGSNGSLPPLPTAANLSVTVTTKAGKDSATTTLQGIGSTATDALGFEIKITDESADTMTLSVASKSNRHALSHVEFDFGTGAAVVAPVAGSSTIQRETLGGSTSTLLLTKEGVFCPPEPDEELSEAIDNVVNP